MSFEGARVFVTGATGLVGGVLCERLLGEGAEVVALSRRKRDDSSLARAGARFVVGDVSEPGAWRHEVDGATAVVHLAGESIVAGRWTERVKAKLRASRIAGTRQVVDAIARAGSPPGVLICASAAGYYGPRGEEVLDEEAAPGDDFLARLCVDWEAEAARAGQGGARVVSLRFGMVLSRHGGALPRMLPPFQLGLGGPLGPAHRYTPWIHVRDAAGLAHFALAGPARAGHEEGGGVLRGAVNAVAPEAVRMGEFARALGGALGRPAVVPVPEFVLRLALGEAAAAVIPGQHVVPRAALAAGYPFALPALRPALEDLVG